MTPQDSAPLLAPGSRELALAGAALVLAGLALTPICVVIARRCVPQAQVFFARWRFLHVGLVALVLLVATSIAPRAIDALTAASPLPEALAGLWAGVLALGLAATAIFFLAARLDPAGVASLGLRGRGSARAAGVGLVCYTLLIPGIFGLSLLWPWLLERLGGEFQLQDLAIALADLGGIQRVQAALLAVIVLPFFEELVFRGFLQPLLVQNLGDRGGVFLASLIFAVLHGDSALLPILGLSLLLGSLMLRTQRLAAPYLVHALHNGLAFLLLGAA